MPEMDGYQVCERLKANEATRDMPVIFISALDEVLDKVKAFRVGGADYVTKPFQVEEVLARVESHLNLRALQKQLQQANIELTEANASLRESNQELDAFAHTVAHDLKNPLAHVLTTVELLGDILTRQEPPSKMVLELLRHIEYGGQKGSRIVDELLLLAGVRKGQVDVQPVDMGGVITQVQQRLTYMFEEYQAELTLPDSWPLVLGYEPWLEEVWSNYISNGLKYGGQPPHLELGATPENDETVRFWVRDNGAGLTLEAQKRLFAEFTRLDKVRAEGHGLGLSIVRRIIEKLGGEVGVESEPGQGSVFYFTLPMVSQ